MKFMLGCVLCSLGVATIVSDLCYQVVGALLGASTTWQMAFGHVCIILAGYAVGCAGSRMLEDDENENVE